MDPTDDPISHRYKNNAMSVLQTNSVNLSTQLTASKRGLFKARSILSVTYEQSD